MNCRTPLLCASLLAASAENADLLAQQVRRVGVEGEHAGQLGLRDLRTPLRGRGASGDRVPGQSLHSGPAGRLRRRHGRGRWFLVTWQSEAQDGSQTGIFAQRFSVSALIDVDGDGLYLPLTDGLLLLRFGFGFTGETLTTNAEGDDCTRCEAAEILDHLHSLL